ncbi:MAG: hypothetical protein MI810_24800 [Flavobacteriales bacterium]|jgi:hypothetical protein|nr:hypothetical protein [Flavobacteriales bacterium]
MKNVLLLVLFLAGFALQSNAQPPHYDDLVILYADGSYEKLLKRAEKYTLKDGTKNDPLPYLYLAKGNYEMSKDAQYAEAYPKAFKDAIKYAGKCLKKDKEGLVLEEYMDFFTDLKVTCVEDIRNLVETKDYNRLRGSIINLQRFDKSDVGSSFLMTAVQYRIKDKSGAKITFKEAMAKLEAIESTNDWRSVDFVMFRIGILEYVSYCEDMGQVEKYQDILGKTKQWMEKDEEFMEVYNRLM